MALGLATAGGLLITSSPAIAEDGVPASWQPAKNGGLDDPNAVGEMLAEWFARFDQSIRTVTTVTDRAASRALEGGLGALAIGEDRRISDRAEDALADAEEAEQRHYDLASVASPPPPDAPGPARRNAGQDAVGSPGRDAATSGPAAPAR